MGCFIYLFWVLCLLWFAALVLLIRICLCFGLCWMLVCLMNDLFERYRCVCFYWCLFVGYCVWLFVLDCGCLVLIVVVLLCCLLCLVIVCVLMLGFWFVFYCWFLTVIVFVLRLVVFLFVCCVLLCFDLLVAWVCMLIVLILILFGG